MVVNVEHQDNKILHFFVNNCFTMRKLIIIIAGICLATISYSQSYNTTDLYLQTSEMNNIMVNYDADHGNIIRFYSTTQGQGGFQQSSYNSPERRQRLLSLIDEYMKQL